MRGLQGKVAIVTGAAAGIGKAIAERLVDEGCMVAWADIDVEGARQASEYCLPGCLQGSFYRVCVCHSRSAGTKCCIFAVSKGSLHAGNQTAARLYTSLRSLVHS